MPTLIYYMLEGGFYVSLLFSVVGDVKRKVGILHTSLSLM